MATPTNNAEIAYYSMEIALRDGLPTFSGGLGVLAGDHVRAGADRELPMAAVTLLYSHGFFVQSVVAGEQRERPVEWSPEALLEELPVRVALTVGGKRVVVGAWRLLVEGASGHTVPVHFLDTNLEENEPADRGITDRLYTSDPYQRLCQEAVLGLGGPLVLEDLGYQSIRLHHVNEGHGSLVPVGLLARRLAGASPAGGLAAARPVDVEAVRRRCVFTTHTPVPAGHDRFAPEVSHAVLGHELVGSLGSLGFLEGDGTLNMTVLGMHFSGFVNGVSLRHGEVTRAMFPAQAVASITNGVHTATWAAPATADLFDRHLPDWRRDSQQLRYACHIPLDELRATHAANKEALCAEVRRRAGVALRPDVVTIGIARRFAAYKRNDLVLRDPERLAAIAEGAGPLQIVFSGKAHPADGDGKAMIRRVAEAAAVVGRGVTVAFLDDYGMALGRRLCAGSDVWLNTPVPPHEASGTSGMKAALNGVPSLSTLDGWWLEGYVEGATGWAVGAGAGAIIGAGIGPAAGADAGTDAGIGPAAADDPGADAGRLYDLLEGVVVPAYYKDRDLVTVMGRHAIALNGSFFSAHRMVDEYVRRAYRPVLADR